MRKSRRSSTSDQRIVDSSDNISEFMWPKWMFCCPKSIFDKQENLRMMRQNSASNLDPYRRPPLPPINRSNTTDDEFHNNLLLSQRLESMRTTESYLNALAGKAENLSVLTDVESGNSNKLFGINITGIRGIPVMPLENNRKRALPIPPSDCFNQL
uniref:Uncharacterized protein n=1 Tax=Setaria digitata TaxID=48799 RepID=A0A915Q2N1_9BILA